MKTSTAQKIAAALFCFGIANVVTASDARDSVVTSVFSRSFNQYQRPTLPDGRDRPLTYVIAKGGFTPGATADESVDGVKFAAVVRVVGKYLAKQSYYPAKDPKKADLMLVVHWGKTVPGNDGLTQSMTDNSIQSFETLQLQMHQGIGRAPGIDVHADQNARARNPITDALDEAAQEEIVQGMHELRFGQDARIAANRYNANLLGYTREMEFRTSPTLYAGTGAAYRDLMQDLESERYYVSVTAYDFQEALQQKNNKGLWRTVASIDAHGNRFDERLITMVERASRYFGRDTDRLIRQFEYTPQINFGELKQLGLVDQAPSGQK